MIRRDWLIAAIAVFCLAISLFMIKPTISQSVREYDPWYDINDDGKIDIKDVYGISLKYGTAGELINKTQMILDLQNRVKALEEELQGARTIRFYAPNETMSDSSNWKDAAVFVWTPRNATNNAILRGYCYFNIRGAGPVVRVLLNETEINFFNWGGGSLPEYAPTRILDLGVQPNMLQPNNDMYIIKLQVRIYDVPPVYVKDVNVLLEVIDGLPPS